MRRRTIYYYVRSGLLPPAQKASPSRALYTDEHVAILAEIESAAHSGSAARGDQVAARRPPEGRRARTGWTWSPVARRRHATPSSRRPHAASRPKGSGARGWRTSIAEVGITPQLLYSALRHQARSLRRLLQGRRPVHERVPAGAVRRSAGCPGAAGLVHVRRLGHQGVRSRHVRTGPGAAQHDDEARRDLREAYETIFREHIDELGRMRRSPQIRRSRTNSSATG